MELGQIKLDYNNEVLKIRKHFIQAKTQCINNLSRKGKQLKASQASEKCPDEIKEKNNRKLESTVAEIFLMKKLKHDEVARFAMINFDKLTKIMDSPLASKDKAMAKLAAHKALNPKLQLIKDKFSHVSTEKLLEIDPKKQRIKKKKKEKSKLKKAELEKSSANIKNIPESNAVSTTEDMEEDGDEILNKFYNTNAKKHVKPAESSDGEESEAIDTDEEDSADITEEIKFSKNISNEEVHDESEQTESDNEESGSDQELDIKVSNSDSEIIDGKDQTEIGKRNEDHVSKCITDNLPKKLVKASKNKHQDKRMFVDMDDDNINSSSQKTVDSFFMTESGDNYLTVAIPRPPDVINNDSGDGEFNQFSNTNRRLRRAAMFGKSVAPRMKKSFESKQYKTSSNTMADFKGSKNFKDVNKQDGYSPKFQRNTDYGSQNNSYSKSNSNDKSMPSAKVPEKLHPSWEAKKQKMAILPFQGKKVTFD